MIYGAKPWLKSYDSGIPENVAIPDATLVDCFQDSFQRFPEALAARYLGTTMSFSQLKERSGRFATALAQNGYGKGDVVAINLPNTPQYIIAMVGALRAGCAVSGLAPLLTPDEMAYQLNDSAASVLVTLDLLFQAKFLPISGKVPGLRTVLVTGIFDPLAAPEQRAQGSPIEGKTVQGFYAFWENQADAPPRVEASSKDACFIQYTGGTTGPSKGAVLSHGNLVANACQFSTWMGMNKGNDVMLSGFPMFHQAGLFVCVCALFMAYTQVLIPDPRNVRHIVDEFKQFKPSYLVNVPSLFLMLLPDEGFRALDFSGLKYCMAGAAPFPVEPMKDLEKVAGKSKVAEVWGMTETSPLMTVNPARGEKKLGSVGLPLPNTKVRIVNTEDGWTEMPIGQEGELLVSGPQVMQGYLNKPEETKTALQTHEGEVWMHTGDVGRMDADGYVYLVDRAKDMIIVGGYKVFSCEVEDKLFKHPAIGMCALVGVPNPARPDSEIVKLVIQKSEDYKDIPDDKVREEVLAFAKEKLAPYKVPKLFEFMEAIPLTSVGKVNKKALRQS